MNKTNDQICIVQDGPTSEVKSGRTRPRLECAWPVVALAAMLATGCSHRSAAPAERTDAAQPVAPASGAAGDAGAPVPDAAVAQVPGPADVAVTPVPPTSASEFIGRGTPTFVLGTAGDDRSDRAIAVQAGLIQAHFPSSKAVADTSFDVAHGAEAWPSQPVVYGGPQVNTVLAALAPSLPFAIAPGRLEIGGTTFEGDDIQLITVVPAHAADAAGPGYPEFLLYAGTGTPGIAEINSFAGRRAEPVIVIDRFGVLAAGLWQTVDGRLAAALGPSARRIGWRSVDRGTVAVRFPDMLPAAADEADTVDACVRGIGKAASALGIAEPVPVAIYVYPDVRSKEELTGEGGDGRAVVGARTIHVLHTTASAMERLLTHEGTHVLAYAAWGPAGTPLIGEGLAVWVTGSYGRDSLAVWKPTLASHPALSDLLAHFAELPERTTYPLAGLLVSVAVRDLGLAAVREHLLAASVADWAEACRAAGTTSEALEAAWNKEIASP